jgi:hypothetical protein
MNEFILTPKVDQAQEFIEIANDFANPLDLVREAISNAFDAHSTDIRLAFETEIISGETTFVIRLRGFEESNSRNRLSSLQTLPRGCHHHGFLFCSTSHAILSPWLVDLRCSRWAMLRPSNTSQASLD